MPPFFKAINIIDSILVLNFRKQVKTQSQGSGVIASHANVLRGSSRVPTPRTFLGEERLRDEPVRTSAWEASGVTQTYQTLASETPSPVFNRQ